MLSDGHEHRVGRKATLAAFHASVIDRHVETITELVKRALSHSPAGTEVALHPLLRSLTLEIILRTLIGHDENST